MGRRYIWMGSQKTCLAVCFLFTRGMVTEYKFIYEKSYINLLAAFIEYVLLRTRQTY